MVAFSRSVLSIVKSLVILSSVKLATVSNGPTPLVIDFCNKQRFGELASPLDNIFMEVIVRYSPKSKVTYTFLLSLDS